MYQIKRDIDNLDGAGVATLTLEAPITPEATPAAEAPQAPIETAAPTEVVAEEGAEASDENVVENDFSFEQEEEGFTPKGSQAAIPLPEITVSKAIHDKVVAELEGLKADFAVLQNAFENPIVKAAVEYQGALETGVEVNPAVFIENYFGIDASRLDVESLIRLQIKDEAASAGINVTEDVIESTLTKRLMRLEDMDDIERAAYEKSLRETRMKASKEKQDKILNERKADIEKGQAFWKDAYENGVKPLIDKMLTEGKKEIGLKTKVSKEDVERISVAIANNFYRFTKSGSLNIPHAIEVAHFSSDMSGYIRKIEASAVERYKAEQLKLKTPTITRPAGTMMDTGSGKMTSKPLTNLLDGATVIK